MDPVSFVASITALISVTAKTVRYLRDTKNATKERQALSREAADLLQRLHSLKSQIEEPQQAKHWNKNLKLLASQHGALDQLQEALQGLSKQLKPRTGLCVQLIDESIRIPETLSKLYDLHECRQTRPKLKEVLSILHDLTGLFRMSYLVIDPSMNVNRKLDDSLILNIVADDDDLNKYILSKLATNSGLSRLLKGQTTLVKEIRDKVIEKANGMFLVARLHLESLTTKMSISTLKKALESLPNTLNELYDDVFRRIDDQSEDGRIFANKALC
ncbi:MAG: hypothetical protein Q9184_007096 [Pyrenodesmia sp. 2 TL-2023]